MANTITREEMCNAAGHELACSAWFMVDQARIDAFAEVTGDRQPIHIDPVAAGGTMFGGTVAQGMLTVSMMSGMAFGALPAMASASASASASVNYGFDKVRFNTPVKSGQRIRGRFTLRDAATRGGDKLMCTFDAVVEIEDAPRPALTAQWLLLYVF